MAYDGINAAMSAVYDAVGMLEHDPDREHVFEVGGAVKALDDTVSREMDRLPSLLEQAKERIAEEDEWPPPVA